MLAMDFLTSVTDPQPDRSYLTFQLSTYTDAMVTVDAVAENIQVPREHIIPIPDMPAWVMGAYNWRGEILWVLDLARYLDLTHSDFHPQCRYYPLLITEVEKQRMGVVVYQVYDILSFSTTAITSAPSTPLPPALTEVLGGCVVSQDSSLFLLLDMKAIYQRAQTKIPVI